LARDSAGKPFYSMKMVSGRSLAEVIEERRTLAERLALLPNVIAVADAMAYAHGQRVIHRDLKPANVLIGPFGETVVIDWGLAAQLSETRRSSHSVATAYEIATSGLTVAGTVMGTPEYMPVEQAEGKPVEERADVYAIGAILYHVLAGQPPYQGSNSKEVLASIAKQDPIPIEQRQPLVPKELATIIRKAMSRDASARYPTAKELAEDLKRFQTGQLVSAHSYSRMALVRRWIGRYRLPVALAAAFLLVLALVGVTSLRRIVREKNRAEAACAQAESQKWAAEASRNDLILVQARNSPAALRLHANNRPGINCSAWRNVFGQDGSCRSGDHRRDETDEESSTGYRRAGTSQGNHYRGSSESFQNKPAPGHGSRRSRYVFVAA
jgi:hypothetical protein